MMLTRTVAPDAAATADESRVAGALLAALILLIPVAAGWVLWHGPGGVGDFNRRVTIAPFDFALLAVLVLWVAQHRGDAFAVASRARPHALVVGALALIATASFVVHPSPRGVELALRVVAGAAVVATIRRVPARAWRGLAILIVALGGAEAMLGIAQAVHGRPFGLRDLEFDGPLYRFGGEHAGRGSMTHPYHLAVLLLVAIGVGLVACRASARPAPWMAAIALCGAGIGATFSRASLIGLGAGVALLVAGGARRRDLRVLGVAAAIVIGVSTTALWMPDGWQARYQATTSGANVDSGRLTLARDATRVIGDHPLLGVGPGRYVLTIAAAPHNGEILPPHDLPLQSAAELGVVGGVLVTALFGWAVIRWLRRDVLTAAACAALLPFFLLDAYPYVFPTGLALTAVWIGMIEHQAARPAAAGTS